MHAYKSKCTLLQNLLQLQYNLSIDGVANYIAYTINQTL